MSIPMGNFYTATLAIILTPLLIAVALIKRCLTFWIRQGVYTPSPSLLFGNAIDIILQRKFIGVEFKDHYDKLKKKGLKYGGYYFLTKPIFVPVDLDLIKQIMTHDFAYFTDHVHYINEKKEPLTADLSSLKGPKWKQLRSKLTPTFTSGKMRMMFQTLLDCTQELIVVVNKAGQKGEALDIKEVFSRFTTDVIGSCAFGLECDSLKNPDSEFRKYGQRFFYTTRWHAIIKLLIFLYPEMLAYINVRTIEKDVHDFFMKIIKQTVNYREQHNIVRKDFVHLLIQLKNNIKINEDEVGGVKDNATADTSITMDQLAAQCFFFFIAGFETSSTTSTFLLYELAQNPQIQNKLREEISMVMAKSNGNLTYDAIMDMPYMDKCINEALRKYPPLSIHTRECTKTYKVPNSDLILQRGCAVFIPVLGIHRDPEYYPDPDIFDPERFSEENKASRHPAAWVPFGDGPRTCIAMRFGIMQVKVGLVALLRNHAFTLNPKTSTPLVMDPLIPFVLSVQNGVWLDAKRIE